jgi:tetratricopeptide (TPR) repeat protein
MAEMAQQKLDLALASSAWAESLNVEPEAYDGWLRQGEALREAGDFEGAITSFKKAQSLAPEEIDPLVGQANTYERMADWWSAAAAWSRLLKSLVAMSRQGTRSALLPMAYLHAINTYRLSNKLERAREMMVEAALVLPDIVRDREFRLMKAQINKASAPAESFPVLVELVRDLPEREDIRFDAASVALSLGQYEVGTEIITPCLRAGQDESFFRLAIDHLERRSDWKAMLSLYDSFHTVRRSESLTSRILAAAVKTRDLVHARWIALSIARRTRTLDAIRTLAVAYEQNGELDRARRLSRLLRRTWPHSTCHKAQYINLVARTKGLTAADKALCDLFEPSWQDKEAAGVYSEAPFFAGEFGEAVRRLRRYLGSHPGDVRRSALLGYALANSEGLAAAERWFEEVACETFQGEEALVGLAHIAMRRRDQELTGARWAKVVSLNPSHTIAMVEYARALYELRDPDKALAVADRRLRSLPSDVTMREFKLWLHSAIGQPHEALKESRALTKYAGRTWSAVKHGIRSAALTGAFEEQRR